VIVPKATLSGSFSIGMTADGVANTPLTARALAYASATVGGCSGTSVYAYINEIVDTANWYDDVIALSIVGGDFSLAALATETLEVRAIPTTGAAFRPPYADLTFSQDGAGAIVTVGAQTGVVTGVAAGTQLVKVTITSKTAIDAGVEVTVPA